MCTIKLHMYEHTKLITTSYFKNIAIVGQQIIIMWIISKLNKLNQISTNSYTEFETIWIQNVILNQNPT